MDKKARIIALIALLHPSISFSADLNYWLSKSINMADSKTDFYMWPGGKPPLIEQFFPLGFSKDGWFAYSKFTEFENGKGKQKLQSFSFFNLACKDNERKDATHHPDKWDKCLFSGSTNTKVLEEYGIQPLDRPVHGSFPARLLDDEYNIEIGYLEQGFNGEMIAIDPKTGKQIDEGPTEPGSYVYLTSKKHGRKRIAFVELEHSDIVPGCIRPVGWIKSPYEDSIVIVLLVGHAYEGNGIPSKADLDAYTADLRNGFQKE